MPPLSSVSTVLAQSGVDVNVDLSLIDSALALVGSGVAAFLTTLALGALLVAFAPDYTDRLTAAVTDEPSDSALYGVFFLLALVVLTVALVVTIIGIFVAVPLVLLAYVVWSFGSAVAFLAVGERLVGDEDGWFKPLLVGAAINGALTFTGVGGIISFVVGATGFGAILKDRFA